VKKYFIAVALFSLSMSALAEHDIKPLTQQRAKMDAEINTRNALLDRLKIKPFTNDTNQLASINSSELSIEYTLEALENYLVSLDNSEKMKDEDLSKKTIEDMRRSLASICESQLVDLKVASDSLENSEIKKQVDKQAKNSEVACDMVKGFIMKNNKPSFIY
jgi:hypothetical protein